MNAKEELQRAYRVRENIDCLLERKEQVRDLLYKVTAVNDGMPHSGGAGDKYGDLVAEFVSLESQIEAEARRYLAVHDELKAKIGLIEDTDLRLVLELRYLNFRSFTDIADFLCWSVRHVYRLHQRALAEFAKIK